MKFTASIGHEVKRTSILTILAALALFALGPSTARATFPGKNGPIAFTALRDIDQQCPPGQSTEYTPADQGIFTMNPDGSNASKVSSQHRPLMCDRLISYYSDYDPSYSPSGKRFAFTQTHWAEANDGYGLNPYGYIAVMNVDGTNRRVLYGVHSSDPAFSPSGKKIIFRDHNKIAVMSSKGRHERRVTGDGERADEPGFFPTGARIVYVSDKSGRKGWSIATIRLDGSHRRRLTDKTSKSLNSPDVSPNGKRIVFGRGTGIYVVRSDGTHKHRLADGSDPVFSPNGKRIAYSRGTGTGGEIMAMMRANGSHEHVVIPTPLPFGVSDLSDLELSQPSSWASK